MIQFDSQRLIIRDYLETDIDAFHQLFTNDDVMNLMPEVKTHSLDESKKFLYESIAESKFDNRNKFFFAIVLKETGAYIGEIGFSVKIDCDEGRVVNLGYFIFPQYWGKGYVTEAVNLLMDYAFLYLDVIKVESGCLHANIGSLKVMEKVGMTRESYLVKHMYYNGKLHDRVDYRMLKEEWLAIRSKELV